MRASTVKLWSRIHKWSSLVCTLFLLMLCLTGLPLIFHDDIDDLLSSGIAAPAMPEQTPQASLDRIADTVRRRYPDQYIQILNWDQGRPNIINVFLSAVPAPPPGQFHKVSLDSRTAAVLEEAPPGRDVMDLVLVLHREMFAGLAGELFLGVMGLLFVVAIVSGLLLYSPFMRRLAFGEIRHAAAPRVKWLDLHNMLGIVTILWALVVGATGVVNAISVPLFNVWRAEVLPPLLAPYQGKPALTNPASIDVAVDLARKALSDDTLVSVIFPTPARFGSPRHYLVWAKGNTPVTARLFTPVMIDAETGAMVRAPGLPLYLRALQVSRPLHFGDYGGMPLKILWALLDLATIVVLSSGLYSVVRQAQGALGQCSSADGVVIG